MSGPRYFYLGTIQFGATYLITSCALQQKLFMPGGAMGVWGPEKAVVRMGLWVYPGGCHGSRSPEEAVVGMDGAMGICRGMPWK